MTNSTRRTLDQYFTPVLLLRALTDVFTIDGDVIEPCNGKGALSQQILNMRHVSSVVTNDIDPKLSAYNDTTQDATDITNSLWQPDPLGYSVCVTNPPFNIADQILHVAMERCFRVALLLRLTFLEPTKKRALLLQRYTPYMSHLIIFGSPRPSFTENGRTDNVTTAWMVWERDHTNDLKIAFVTDWKK